MSGIAATGTSIAFGAVPTIVAGVTNISGLDGSADEIDVTSHDSASAYREYVPSFIDAGEVSVDLNFQPAVATHKAITGGIIYLRDQRTVGPWVIAFPGTPAPKASFNGFVKSIVVDAPVNGALTASMTIRCTGAITWTYV